MRVDREAEHDAVLPRTNSFRLLGRALLVKKVDVAAEITYGHYRYAVGAAR